MPDETDSPQSSTEPTRPDQPPSSEGPMPPDSDEAPAIEDGYAPEGPSEELVAEDDLDLLDPSTRSLDAAGADTEEDTAEVAPPSAAAIETDEAGDADRISDEPDTDTEPTQPMPVASRDRRPTTGHPPYSLQRGNGIEASSMRTRNTETDPKV